MPTGSKRSAWAITLAAAAILMVTMGTTQSLGLFIAPLKSSTGLGITTISLAFAVAQLMWGNSREPVSIRAGGSAYATRRRWITSSLTLRRSRRLPWARCSLCVW
jgi:hypothetical protein